MTPVGKRRNSSREGGRSDEALGHQELAAGNKFHANTGVQKPDKKKVCSFPNCGKSFTRVNNLRKHILSHDPELKQNSFVPCPICKIMVKKDHLGTHVTRHDPKNKKHKCETCDKLFWEPAHLRLHEYTHQAPSEKPVLACPLCDFTTSLQKYLIKHTKSVHIPKPSIHACSACDMKFSDRRMLKEHQMSHRKVAPPWLEEQSFRCQECDKSCTTPDILKLHTELVHNSGADDDGSKSFSSEWRVKYYQDADGPESMVHCPICLKQVQMLGLKKHYLRHDIKNKIHKCDKCEQAFFKAGALSRHLLIHRSPSEKDISCDLCDYRTFHKDSLKIHVRRSHTPHAESQECTVSSHSEGRAAHYLI